MHDEIGADRRADRIRDGNAAVSHGDRGADGSEPIEVAA
jgi:hypothetical protein